MQEAFVHYIWQYQKFDSQRLNTQDGESITIFDPGKAHQDEGPDFRNARLRIGPTLWAGNVEIHIKASDWLAHKHENDPNYDSVILHVVYEADQAIYRSTGESIPTLELKGRIAEKLESRYRWILSSRHWIPCLEHFQEVSSFRKRVFMERLLVERFEYRARYFDQILQFYRGHWEQSFFHVLAGGFGIPVNQLPFEMLARSCSLKLIQRHSNSPFQVEALIFGQAGFLEVPSPDRYHASLQSEYLHLARKFGLHPIDRHVWHFLRLRPASFPTVRLAQFAATLSKKPQLFAQIQEAKTKKEWLQLLTNEVSEYWMEHYRFGIKAKKVPQKPGRAFIERLMANALIPFLYFYLKKRGKISEQEKIFELLSSCKGEQNKILKQWERLGMPNHNAFDSQSLMQWKKQYCDQRKCLKCVVGNALLGS